MNRNVKEYTKTPQTHLYPSQVLYGHSFLALIERKKLSENFEYHLKNDRQTMTDFKSVKLFRSEPYTKQVGKSTKILNEQLANEIN